MSNLEEEIRELKEKNNELVVKVQYWKMAAAQREEEKLALMKENNELRLKLNHVKYSNRIQSMNIETALQAGNEKALGHLVRASTEIANIMELTKNYFRDMQELDAKAPRWSTIGGTPAVEKSEKVHRVPPTLVGGRSIQPVVSLSRTLFNTDASVSRSPNQNRSTERAVPIHMLQDVYIPLTRIDAETRGNNIDMVADRNQDLDDSTEDMGLEEDALSEGEEFETSPRLDAVAEDIEPEEEEVISSQRSRLEDGLEGPSWMLGPPPSSRQGSTSNTRRKEEPDSTTGVNELKRESSSESGQTTRDEANSSEISMRVSYSPTVRRRRRISSPPPQPTPRHSPFSPKLNSTRRNSVFDRVLKVMVTKIQLNGDEDSNTDVTPPKRTKTERLMSLDAPSPSGTTDSRVIVLDTCEEVASPMNNVTVRNRNSRRDRHRLRCERNKCSDHNRNERSDHTDQIASSEQNDGSDHFESDQNSIYTQDEHSDRSVSRPPNRKERRKGKEKNSSNESEPQNFNDNNMHTSRNASGDTSEHSESRDLSNQTERRDQNDCDQQNSRSDQRNNLNKSRSVSRERDLSTEGSDRNEYRGRSNRRDRSADKSDRRMQSDQHNASNSNVNTKRSVSRESLLPEHSDQRDRSRSDLREQIDQRNASDTNTNARRSVSRESLRPDYSDQRDRIEYRGRSDRRKQNDKSNTGDSNVNVSRNVRREGSARLGRRDQCDRNDQSSDCREQSDGIVDLGRHENSDRSNCSRDSDSGSISESVTEGGRSRRARKAVTYKEKPLNRKMRR